MHAKQPSRAPIFCHSGRGECTGAAKKGPHRQSGTPFCGQWGKGGSGISALGPLPGAAGRICRDAEPASHKGKDLDNHKSPLVYCCHARAV